MNLKMPASDDEHPTKVTGGCLCGAIRYTINFDEEGSWPPDGSNCQCFQCRKFSGALQSHALFLPQNLITPAWSTHPTFTLYQSGTNTQRAFCSTCGSSLAWFSTAMPDKFILFNGTIDEDFLNGPKIDGTERKTEYGREFERGPGYGEILARQNLGNLYWQNKIPGITDCDIGGPKYLQDLDDKPLPKKRW